ncbi:MAG: hypothetical protein HQL41_13235 [Alphaproteobacteria bacterium]|nr:hypothetical protein [Alphaproteobacteria bacterium]
MTFDLHYHGNVFGTSAGVRGRRLRAHRQALELAGVDFVASTEHAYKLPLDAFLYLREATEGIHTTILPAVEAISREGVDVIFLYPDEAALRWALRDLQPFGFALRDFGRLRDATGGLALIPHPFTPGRTGMASALGSELFLELSPQADYVEVHNGSALHIINLYDERKLARIGHRLTRLRNMHELPMDLRDEGAGWAIGSDAHFPGHQFVVGATDEALPEGGWFELLSRRLKFREVGVRPPARLSRRYNHLVRSGYCAMSEAAIKLSHRMALAG